LQSTKEGRPEKAGRPFRLPSAAGDKTSMGRRTFMTNLLNLNTVCAPSQDVVAREIEGEMLIIPVVAGIGEEGDELYTLSETGQAIWQKLDGQRTLRDVADLLTDEFDAPNGEIENHVLGFVSALTRRGLVVTK
jgi:Coenzyme PQQ synthesis protein D (PqqD)